MDCWHILQIEPTSDERAIKRAYAKLLKTTRPDDDAEGYQRLREAFDEALAIAPYLASEAAPEWSFPASEWLPENERSEFRQNGQSGFGQADSHHALPPWQASSPNEHHTYRFSGSPNPDTAENERLPENGNLPEADELFSGSPHPCGSDPCAPLLSNIETYFTRGGAAELEAAWPSIREQLEQLPLGETENASRQFANFLRTHQIDDCMLWTQWSDYFGWHHPDVRNNVLSPAELQQLKEYRKAAAKLAKHRAKKANRRRKLLSANEIITHIEDTFKRSGGKGLMRLWDSIAAEIAATSEEELVRVLAYLAQWLQQPYGLPEKLQNRWRQDYSLAPFHLETDKLQYWLEGWYAAGSSRKLAEKWPEIRALLNRMPANEKDKASAYCAAFINRHNLSSSIVHTQWAAYFGWPDNETPPIEPGQSFSGSLNPDTAENERLPENGNPPEAFVYPFDPDIGDTFSGSPNPYGSDPCAALLDDIESRFERGGVPELEAAWPHIRERLEQLPLGETENASYQFADFLRTHQIDDCMLWAQWSDYFGWHHPDFRNNIFTPAELEQIKEYRRIAAKLAKHRAKTQRTQSFAPLIGQAAAQLLAQWRQWFKQGGSEELLRRWPETSRILDNVPPQEHRDVAAACLDFLHHNQIRHPLLWAYLANYSGWTHAFFQEVRDPEGLARLEEYRRTADIIHLFEPEAARPDEDGGKPEKRLPVSALFAHFLGTTPSLMRRLFAAFAAMLLWPELSGEANRRQRWLLHTYRPVIHKRYDFWHGCRIAWVVICILTAVIGSLAAGGSPNGGLDLLADFMLVVVILAAMQVVYAVGSNNIYSALESLNPGLGESFNHFKYRTGWGKAIHLLLYPAILVLFAPVLPAEPWWNIGYLAVLLACWTYYFWHLEEDTAGWSTSNLCLLGLAFLIFSFPIPKGYGRYILAATLLWLNSNFYLLFDRPAWLDKIEWLIRQALSLQTLQRLPWQLLLLTGVASLGGSILSGNQLLGLTILLLPWRIIFAALLWLLLLPVHTARLAMQEKSGVLLEIGTGAIILLALLNWSNLSPYPDNLLLFYPAILLSALLRRMVLWLICRLLKIGDKAV